MKDFSTQRIISFFLPIIFSFVFFYWVLIVIQNPIKTKQEQPSINKKLTSQTISGFAIVVDGDTIKINKNRIRLMGIDAPETKQKCLDKNYYEYFCGEVSTNFLKKLIGNKNVECKYEKKDIYNRYLAWCKMSEININHKMVQQGMAIIYSLKEASVELKNLEAEAKNKKLGVWQGAFMEPKEYRKKVNHRNASATLNK